MKTSSLLVLIVFFFGCLLGVAAMGFATSHRYLPNDFYTNLWMDFVRVLAGVLIAVIIFFLRKLF